MIMNDTLTIKVRANFLRGNRCFVIAREKPTCPSGSFFFRRMVKIAMCVYIGEYVFADGYRDGYANAEERSRRTSYTEER